MFKKKIERVSRDSRFLLPKLWFVQVSPVYASGKHFRARNVAAAPDVGAVRPTLQDCKSCVFFFSAEVNNTWTATQAHCIRKCMENTENA